MKDPWKELINVASLGAAISFSRTWGQYSLAGTQWDEIGDAIGWQPEAAMNWYYRIEKAKEEEEEE